MTDTEYAQMIYEDQKSSIGMNYRLVNDGIYTTIELTYEEPNGASVFKTLDEAKREALASLRYIRDEYSAAVRRISDLRKDDIQSEWHA